MMDNRVYYRMSSPKYDFSKGKIYVLRWIDNNKIFYVGSTTNSLVEKEKEHMEKLYTLRDGKYVYNSKLYRKIRGKKVYKSFYIDSYKRFSCTYRQELLNEQRRIIEELRDKGIKLINKIQAYNPNNNDPILVCPCGVSFRKRSRKKHKRSTQHHKYIRSFDNENYKYDPEDELIKQLISPQEIEKMPTKKIDKPKEKIIDIRQSRQADVQNDPENICVCGSRYTGSKKKHNLSAIHLKYITDHNYGFLADLNKSDTNDFFDQIGLN